MRPANVHSSLCVHLHTVSAEFWQVKAVKVASEDSDEHSGLKPISILMSNENAPLFRCAYLWPIKSCAKLSYL